MRTCQKLAVVVALGAGLLALSSTPAHAVDQKMYPEHRIQYTSLFAARLNPLGLEERFSLFYRYRLIDDAAPLFREAALGVGFTPSFSPGVMRLGATVEARPLTVLLVSASYHFARWFGTFNLIQSWESARDDHSDSTIEDRADDGLNYATSGHEVQIRGQLLAKVKDFVIRNDMRFTWYDYDLRGANQQVFYNQRTDQLLANGGWGLVNETDLLWVTDFPLVAGVRTSVANVYYRDEDFRQGEKKRDLNTPQVRVGPLLAWRFSQDKDAGWFQSPTAILIAQWWMKHKFRTGQDVSQGVPYFVLGFRFTGGPWGI